MNSSRQTWELQTRRLRLLSDITEDYQENMRRIIRLLGCELGISNNVFPNMNGNQRSTSTVDDWIDHISQTTNDLYEPNRPNTERRRDDEEEDPPYSFNRLPRRAFVYTSLETPRAPRNQENRDTGLNPSQIENSTQLIQYDASMNVTRCPITWDEFEHGQNVLRINECGHIFKQSALMEWFQRHSRCPVCRTGISRATTSSSSSVSNPTPTSTPTSGTLASNTNPASETLSQLVSGIITGVNGAITASSGLYESEIEFNVTDLMDAYNQLLSSQSSSQPTPNP